MMEYELPGYVTHMSAQLFELQQRGYMCDAVIATTSGLINVHKLVLLASKSPVLVESVQNAEKSGGPLCLINISADIGDVQHFVRVLYTGKCELCSQSIERMMDIFSTMKMDEDLSFLKQEKEKLAGCSKAMDTSFACTITSVHTVEENTCIDNPESSNEEIHVLSKEQVQSFKIHEGAETNVGKDEIELSNGLNMVEVKTRDVDLEVKDECQSNSNSSASIKRKREPIPPTEHRSKLQKLNTGPTEEDTQTETTDSIVTTHLEGSMCEPRENIISSENYIDLTDSPKGSMEEPFEKTKLEHKSSEEINTVSVQVNRGDSKSVELEDLVPQEKDVQSEKKEMEQVAEVENVVSGESDPLKITNCGSAEEKQQHAKTDNSTMETVDRTGDAKSVPEQRSERMVSNVAAKITDKGSERWESITQEQTSVGNDSLMLHVSATIHSNAVSSSNDLADQNLHKVCHDDKPVTCVVDMKSSHPSNDSIVVQFNVNENLVSASETPGLNVQVDDPKVCHVTGIAETEKAHLSSSLNPLLLKQTSGVEDVSAEESCQSMSDISNDELPDSPVKGSAPNIKQSVEYENVSDLESVSEESEEDRAIEYEAVSEGEGSNKDEKIDYDTVSDKSMDKDEMEYETISECSSEDRQPIEYEVVSGDEEEEEAGRTEEDTVAPSDSVSQQKSKISNTKESGKNLLSKKSLLVKKKDHDEVKKNQGTESAPIEVDESGSDISLKTLDEEHYDSDDDVAIIRCYKCTANFIDKEQYYEHIKEHEKDEFDAYKYRVDADEYDAYKYRDTAAEEEQKYNQTIKCPECEETFVSVIAFQDHQAYHKHQKMLEKLSKIEDLLDKDDDSKADVPSISSFGSEKSLRRKKCMSTDRDEFHTKAHSREASITRDFFSSPKAEESRWSRSRSREMRRSRSGSTLSGVSSFSSDDSRYQRRRRSSSDRPSDRRFSRERSYERRSKSRSWSRSRSWSWERQRHHSRESRSPSVDSSRGKRVYRKYSRERSWSGSTSSSFSRHSRERGRSASSSSDRERREIEMNLESALNEMVSSYADEPRDTRIVERRKSSEKGKESIDTFDWLASLQNPSEKKKGEKKSKKKQHSSSTKTMAETMPSLSKAAPSISTPTQSVPYQNYQAGNIASVFTSISTGVPIVQSLNQAGHPGAMVAQSSQTGLAQQAWSNQSASSIGQNVLARASVLQQGQQRLNTLVPSSLAHIPNASAQAIMTSTSFTAVTTQASLPLKGILKNTSSQPSSAAASLAVSSGRQLISIPTTGPRFFTPKTVTSALPSQTMSAFSKAKSATDSRRASSSPPTEEEMSIASSSQEVFSTLEPVYVPRPENPGTSEAVGQCTSQGTTETSAASENWNTVTMFLELTEEEEEIKRTELKKSRSVLFQKLKSSPEEEKPKIQKEIQRIKLLVHKLYHKLIKCPTCEFHTRDPREYNRHQRIRCRNKLICHHCERTFSTQEETQAHLVTHKKTCEVCSQVFFNESRYAEHLETHKKK